MISIELTDTKDFMNKLLRTEIFDNFLLQEAVITKAASYITCKRAFTAPQSLRKMV